MRRFLLVLSVAFCAILFSGCDVLESYQFDGSLTPSDEEEFDAGDAITSVDSITINLATDCTTQEDNPPASGQVVIDGAIYTAVSGVCADNVEVEQDENGELIAITLEGDRYEIISTNDSTFRGGGIWVLQDAEQVQHIGLVTKLADDSPVAPGATFFTLTKGIETVYFGELTAPVVTPETIATFISDGLDAGTIGNGDANPLLNHLGQMNDALDQGKTKQAQKKLDNLIDRAERNAGDSFYDSLLTQLQAINPL